MSTWKESNILEKGGFGWFVYIVVNDVKQHTKFQERPSFSQGCEATSSKQYRVTNLPALVANSKSKFLSVFYSFDVFG